MSSVVKGVQDCARKAFKEAAVSVRKELAEMCSPEGTIAAGTAIPQESEVSADIRIRAEDDVELDSEHFNIKSIYDLAAKKLRHDWNQNDQNAAKSLQRGDSIKGRLLNYALGLPMKASLQPDEESLLILSLSSIVNTLDSSMYQTYQEILKAGQFDIISQLNTFDEYHTDVLDMYDNVLNISSDIDSLLRSISQKNFELIDSNKRKTDSYRMLCMLEFTAEYLDKEPTDDASEISFYRRLFVVPKSISVGSTPSPNVIDTL